jgi:hypothetical protein
MVLLSRRSSGYCGRQVTEAPCAVIAIIHVEPHNVIEPHNVTLLVQLDAPAIELDLMQPLRTARRCRAEHRGIWGDKLEHCGCVYERRALGQIFDS